MWATIKKEVISLLLFCFPDQHILLMLKRPRVKVTEKKKKSYSVPDKRASLSEETCIDSRVCVEEGAGGRQCEVEVRPGWHGRGVVTCGPTHASCRYPAPEDLLTVMSFDSCHLLCVVKILWRGHGVLVFDVLFFFFFWLFLSFFSFSFSAAQKWVKVVFWTFIKTGLQVVIYFFDGGWCVRDFFGERRSLCTLEAGE